METLLDFQKGQMEKTNGQNGKDIASDYQHIPGWGMDADAENDPTYPMKHNTGADHQRLNYERAPQQRVDVEILQSVERPAITRVFGTSTPPSGLSGLIRRFAYKKYSENIPAHWMTLILADKINVVEGLIDDFKKGTVPNLWVEKGWRSEWRTNREGVIKNVAVATLAATAVFLIMSQRRKKRLNS